MHDHRKLFANGRSQAVRLPREFRFAGREARIRRFGRAARRAGRDRRRRLVRRPRPLRGAVRAGGARPARSAGAARLRVSWLLGHQRLHRAHQRPARARAPSAAVGADPGRSGRGLLGRAVRALVRRRQSARSAANSERLAVFLAPFEALPFDDDDARAAGAIRAALEQAGTPIGAYDTLLAGQALHRNLTLVTANVAEFEPGKRPQLAELGRVSGPPTPPVWHSEPRPKAAWADGPGPASPRST